MISFIVILLALLLNRFILIFNEDLLLCASLILFFFLIYILLKDSIKSYNFFKVVKLYYIFILLFKINMFYNFIYYKCLNISILNIYNTIIKYKNLRKIIYNEFFTSINDFIFFFILLIKQKLLQIFINDIINFISFIEKINKNKLINDIFLFFKLY